MTKSEMVSDYVHACYEALTEWGDGKADVGWTGEKFQAVHSGFISPIVPFVDHHVETQQFCPDSIDNYTEDEFVEMVVECWTTEMVRLFEDAGII